MNVKEHIFGSINGKSIRAYTVNTDQGMELTCIEYGCVITNIKVPDREGKVEDVVLGFDSIDEYLDHSPFFGCTIGRNAGRIEGAQFRIDGKTYTLTKNDGENNLHSGPDGFHNVIWESSYEAKDSEIVIIFTHKSPDSTGGFPGNLDTTVKYTITSNNELIISYDAVSDKKTVVNLTNHTYFNLSGNLRESILNHRLALKSSAYLELDDHFIPTGKAVPVEGTVFDFRQAQQVAKGIESNDPQTKLVGGGYDHPFLLSSNHQEEIVLIDNESGRKLVVETDEPAVVFYTGNSLTNDFLIRGRQSEKYLGLCLETQKAPNMFNDPGFPSIILDAHTPYKSKTKYSFKVI